MRLFAALPLTSLAVERLMSLRLRLSAPKDGLRWSQPEQWHIALQFYGDVDPKLNECLHTQLSEADLTSPEVYIESLGMFASKGILYAAVEPTASLLALEREVIARSRLCGVVPEDRPFRPHITLARSKGKIGADTLRRLAVPALLQFGSAIRWRAPECLLIESTLRPQGAEYTVRSSIPLGSGIA